MDMLQYIDVKNNKVSRKCMKIKYFVTYFFPIYRNIYFKFCLNVHFKLIYID